MKKKKEKKKLVIFEKVATIAKIICVILLLLIIAVLALQRFSDNKAAIGGFRIFSVSTGSMLPVYEVGDVLIVKEVDTNTLKVGDDVTYLGEKDSFADRVVTHRIIEIEEPNEENNERVFHTQGTANDVQDPAIKGDRIFGKVVYKTILISMLIKLMNNGNALFIFIFIPIAIIIFLQIKQNMDAKNEEDEEEDEEEEDDDDDDDEEDDDN